MLTTLKSRGESQHQTFSWWQHNYSNPLLHLWSRSEPPQSLHPALCHAPLYFQVLVFEDAPNGVEAAKAAGMYVIMVPDKRTHSDRTRLADKVLDSLENVDLEGLGLCPLPKH